MVSIQIVSILLIIVVLFIVYLLLAKPGRGVTPAKFVVIDTERDCARLPTCFFQNPSTPYGRVLYPQEDNPQSQIEQFFGVTTLNPLQAIVLRGFPPDALYWSFLPYLWRFGSDEFIYFASLSDGVSNYNTPVKPGKEIAVIATRNRRVFYEETSFLISTGFDGTIVPLYFPELIGDTDLVTVLSRATIFPSDEATTAYRTNPRFQAYKVTYQDLPFVSVPVHLPGQGFKIGDINLISNPETPTELTQVVGYEQFIVQNVDLLNVVQVILMRPFLSLTLNEPYSNGYQCITNKINCQGDNPQTYYGISDRFFARAGQRIQIVGFNHARFGRAIYAQVSLYDDDGGFGLEAITAFKDDPLVYTGVFEITVSRNYRLAERAYVQEPEMIGPDANTIIPARGFLFNF